MHFLVVNDDGVFAPGIQALAQCLRPLGKVTVIAPDRNQSAASNSLTLDSPIRIRQLDNGDYAVAGTPTDAVHLALCGWLKEKPDIVVSGINNGANLGDDVLYSGTVAAAMEARYVGIPAMAFSLATDAFVDQHWDTACEVVKQLITAFQKRRLPARALLNVNIPNIPRDALKGVRVARLGHRHASEPLIEARDPKGRPVYWVGPPGEGADAGPGTDFHALSEHYASVTPLQMDLTHYGALEKVAPWLENGNDV